MTATQEQLIARARERRGLVLPCGSRRTLEECFTTLPSGDLVFWFNTPDGNTHVEHSAVAWDAREYTRVWRKNHPEAVREHNRRSHKKHPDKKREQDARYRLNLKRQTFLHYGGLACAICGEGKIEKLTIDHENGDGSTFRRSFNRHIRGQHFYIWLRKQGYPTNLGLRVLCVSCNAKEYYTQKSRQKKGGMEITS